MQALLRHKAAEEAQKARGEAIRQRRLAETEQQRLLKLREKEQKRAQHLEQDERRRRDRQAQEESAMRAHLRHKAAVQAQKAEEKLVRQAALRAGIESQSNRRATRVIQA
jgi:hypothetical protein